MYTHKIIHTNLMIQIFSNAKDLYKLFEKIEFHITKFVKKNNKKDKFLRKYWKKYSA